MLPPLKNNLIAALLGGAMFSTAGLAGAATANSLLADSVAEFSGVQGQDNWFYGYESGSTYSQGAFLLLANNVNSTVWNNANVWTNGTTYPNFANWTALAAFGGHPNGLNTGNVEQIAVRRWVSEVTGPIALSGVLQNIDSGSVVGSIYVNGTNIWSAISNGTSDSKSYSLLANVATGTTVDFVISSNGVDFNDSTRFTTQITAAVPEPESYAFLLAGLGVIGAMVRRRRS